jgi:hypothetical protein
MVWYEAQWSSSSQHFLFSLLLSDRRFVEKDRANTQTVSPVRFRFIFETSTLTFLLCQFLSSSCAATSRIVTANKHPPTCSSWCAGVC